MAAISDDAIKLLEASLARADGDPTRLALELLAELVIRAERTNALLEEIVQER